LPLRFFSGVRKALSEYLRFAYSPVRECKQKVAKAAKGKRKNFGKTIEGKIISNSRIEALIILPFREPFACFAGKNK